jgi:hypothetical protein
MVDAVQIFPPNFRITDNATGAPVSGAKINFYNATTTTPKTVYSDSALSASLGATVYCDSLGTPVASFGSSTAVMVYTGTAAYKVVITDADDNIIRTLDNIKGALDTSTFLTTGSTSTLTQPVITKTANYTIVAADRSKLIEANTTGGQFTLTLTAAATLGDNWSVKVRCSGTANQVILAASENIAFEGQNFTARAFQIGEGAEIICDGTGFKLVGHTPPLMASRAPAVIPIVDLVSAAPGSPTAGARYIVSGAFSTYSVGDIIEANGASFNKYTPPTDCGWLAYVQDENTLYQFQASAWVSLTASTAQAQTGTDNTAFMTALAVRNAFLLTSGSVSSAATLDLVLSTYTGYRGFLISLAGFVPATDGVDLWCRFSTDAGSTYDATGYNYAVNSVNDTPTATAVGSGSANQIVMTNTGANNQIGNGANEGYFGEIKLLKNTSAAFWSRVFFDGYYITNNGTPQGEHSAGGGARETAQDTDAIRFMFSSGNIASGDYAVYGLI